MNNCVDQTVLFGEAVIRNDSPNFAGGTLTAPFGEIVLDLMQASLASDGATITAIAMMGSVEIRVPLGWRVELMGLPLFGSNEDLTEHPATTAHVPTLRVVCMSAFGSVEVVNGHATQQRLAAQ